MNFRCGLGNFLDVQTVSFQSPECLGFLFWFVVCKSATIFVALSSLPPVLRIAVPACLQRYRLQLSITTVVALMSRESLKEILVKCVIWGLFLPSRRLSWDETATFWDSRSSQLLRSHFRFAIILVYGGLFRTKTWSCSNLQLTP